MKKTFISPQISVYRFGSVNIVTTSGTEQQGIQAAAAAKKMLTDQNVEAEKIMMFTW
ncbi:MAG: hypothetical protein ACI38A_02650 [Candidatus Ornithomonoglobus sp.]